MPIYIPNSPLQFIAPTLSVLEISGPDSEKFLHGQLTCEVRNLAENTWIAGGYCSPQGKLWSNFHLRREQDSYYLVMDRDLLANMQLQLKKYAVFSKVEITDLGESYAVMITWGHALTDISKSEQVAPELAITLIKQDESIQRDLPASDELWHQATFSIGWVSVPNALAGEHLPQVFNLDKHGGISFKKGCYIGQEPIARMHYRGQTKRRAGRFIGSASELPQVNDTLSMKVGENWRRAGAILSSVRYDDGVVALFAIVSSDVDETTEFRIEGQDDSQFTHCPIKT